jgi:superfamily II DNA or RNA helicase
MVVDTLANRLVEKLNSELMGKFISEISNKYNVPRTEVQNAWKETNRFSPIGEKIGENNEKKEKPPFTPTPITLRNYQVGCVDQVFNLWKKGLPGVISSDPGSGKTYMGTELTKLWGADRVFVFAPKSSLSKWRTVLGSYYPSEKMHVSTYDAWAKCGTREQIKKNQPYTYKVESWVNDIRIIDFYPTQSWLNLISTEKVVIILDEFHRLQKKSQRTMAMAANTISLVSHGKNSRLLSLSWTPCDKMEDIPTHLYLFGMVKTNKLVYYDRSIELYNVDGITNVAGIAESFGHDLSAKRNEIENIQYMNGKSVIRKANELAGKIFLKYIRPNIVFSCKPDFVLNPALKPQYINYFCKVSKQTEEEIINIIGMKKGAENQEIMGQFAAIPEGAGAAMAILTFIQKNLEKIKIPLYVDVAKEWLDSDPTNKIAIMVTYLATIDYVYSKLEKYGVSIIKGDIKPKDRDINIAAFQEENTKCRVIVCTLPTGGESIDLHDISVGGKYRRMILIPPTFYCKSMVQAAGRVFRDGVTSNAVIKVLYTTSGSVPFDISNDELNLEKRFYDGVRKKTNTIKRYHAEDQDSLLPCNYEMVVSEKIYDGLVGLEKIEDYNKIVEPSPLNRKMTEKEREDFTVNLMLKYLSDTGVRKGLIELEAMKPYEVKF